jgi:hypothetical protein
MMGGCTMRLAIKVLLVGVGVALLIAGFPSPRTDATTGGGDLTSVGSVTSRQPSDRDQDPTDNEQSPAEREGRDDTAVTGTAAERARAAAKAAVAGATVRHVERETNDDDTRRGGFEVELVRPNGTTVEVELDAAYKVLGTDQEDDRGDD